MTVGCRRLHCVTRIVACHLSLFEASIVPSFTPFSMLPQKSAQGKEFPPLCVCVPVMFANRTDS